MKRGCLLTLLLWGVLFGTYYSYFRDRYEEPAPWVAALAGAFFTSLGLGFLNNGRQAHKDARLLRSALTGGMPQDGKMWAASGTINPIGDPMLSPFTHKPCVVYGYEIYREVVTSNKGSTSRSKHMYYSGFALTPSAVRTPIGDVKVLGFPVPDEFPKDFVTTSDGHANARMYLETTEFLPLTGFAPGRMYGEIKDVMSDDDGSVRKDWRIAKDEPNLSDCQLEEQVVPAGAQVSVLGLYSASKRGLVPDVGGAGMVNRIFPGGAGVVAAQRSKSVVANVIGGVIVLALTQVVLWAVLERRHNFYMPNRQEKLITAARNGETAEIGRLLKLGTDPNKATANGTALLHAVDADTARFLLEHGANPSTPGEDGDTPLMAAARAGDTERIELLLKAGADLDARRPRTTETALVAALDQEEDAAAELLRKAGAKDNTVTAANGDAVDPKKDGADGPLAACNAYLAAIEAEDRGKLKELSTNPDARVFDGIDFSVWKSSRPLKPSVVSGYRNAQAATVTLRGATGTGNEATWLYQLTYRDGKWQVARERWLTKAGAPAEGDVVPVER